MPTPYTAMLVARISTLYVRESYSFFLIKQLKSIMYKLIVIFISSAGYSPHVHKE